MMRDLWLVILVCVAKCSAMSKNELEDFSNFLLKTSQLDLQVKKGADPDDASDEDEVASDHAWEDSGKFEGDLILNDRQRRLIVENVEGLSRNGLTDSTKRWPNNEVIYFIQKEHFNGGQVQAIQEGIDDLAQASCVKFRPYRKGDRDAVVIQGSRRGCFSQVGYQGGYQVLNLSGRHPIGRGCFRHGTVVHELLHTLGFYHMQSSPDRDDYINVVWSNIIQPARHNFQKYNSFAVSDFGVGYDYDSVLHYSRRAFSANGQDTLVPKQRGAEIGQRVGLSDKDTQKLNKMYCDADSDQFQADESTPQKPKNKKKKPKNQPFEGHGIGYHQGKTVVIKLPEAATYKLSNVPSNDVFDFSKTPQVVSTPEAEGYRFGKEVIYPYNIPISLYADTAKANQNGYHEDKPYDNKNKFKQAQVFNDKTDSTRVEKSGIAITSIESDDVKPKYVPIDEYDRDLKDAFDRFTEIVKQQVYPQNHKVYKINKDYSKLHNTPPKFKKTNSFKEPFDEKHKKPVHDDPPTSTSWKHIELKKNKTELDEITDDKQSDSTNKYIENKMDSSFRTLIPIKKPYNGYEQTKTSPYVTLDYLKDRHNYSSLYFPKLSDDDRKGPHIVFNDKLPPTEGDWYKKDYLKQNPAYYDRGFFTDYVKAETSGQLTDPSNEHSNKSSKALVNRNQANYNPGKYDESFFKDYLLPESKNARLADKLNKYDDENNTLSLKLQRKHKTDYDLYNIGNEREEDSGRYDENSKSLPNKSTAMHNQLNYDKEFDTDDLKEKKNDDMKDESDDYDEKSIVSPKKSLKHDEEDYKKGFYTENEKEAKVMSSKLYAPDYYHYDVENSKGLPKKSEAYSLFGAPVPISRDWYKPNYDIPDILVSHEDPYSEESSKLHEDNR